MEWWLPSQFAFIMGKDGGQIERGNSFNQEVDQIVLRQPVSRLKAETYKSDREPIHDRSCSLESRQNVFTHINHSNLAFKRQYWDRLLGGSPASSIVPSNRSLCANRPFVVHGRPIARAYVSAWPISFAVETPQSTNAADRTLRSSPRDPINVPATTRRSPIPQSAPLPCWSSEPCEHILG